MKKIKHLLLFLIAIWMWQLPANSAPTGVIETGGLGAGMFNQLQRDGSGVYDTMQKDQIKRYNVEKNLISPVEKIQTTEDEDKFEVDIQRDLEKDGVVYNPQFLVRKVKFEGNTKIKSKVLESIGSDVIDHEIYFEDLLTYALRISRYYQSKGYLTSYAYVPAQQIKDGVVTICIVESTVGDVEVTGNKWARTWYLKNVMMGRDGLREGSVFNARALQGALREMNEETYMQAQSTISKNGDDTKIDLEVRDKFPLKFNFSWDDYGRTYTGVQRASFLLGLDNLTGFGDKIYGGTILSSGSTGVLAGYSIPVSPYGTRVSFDYSNSNINLGGPYRFLNVKGRSQSIGVRVTHPIIRNAKTDVVVYTGIDFVDADTYSKRLNYTLSDYKLYVIRSGIRGIRDDKYGRWLGTLGVDVGLGGTSKLATPSDGTFVKIVAGATRVHRLWGRVIGLVRVNGQYSPNKLFAVEQMQMGGPYTLRGYQPAELIGDYGVTGTVEVRTPIPGFKKILPKKLKFVDDRVRLAAFYDFGWIKENGHIYNYPQNFLHSVGFGSYINLTDWLSMQFGVGFPLGTKYYDESTARFYFGINSEMDNLIPFRKTEKL